MGIQSTRDKQHSDTPPSTSPLYSTVPPFLLIEFDRISCPFRKIKWPVRYMIVLVYLLVVEWREPSINQPISAILVHL